MRMFHYFAILVALAVPALFATALLGIFGQLEWHLKVGLLSAIFLIGVHTLMIVFMIVTGRVLREAVRVRDLPQSFLDELNVFFAKKAAYPAAIFGAFSIVSAGVLGYGTQGFGLPPSVHMLVGLLALVLNLWAFTVEVRALRDNQALVDRAAQELDSIDAELASRGELPEETDEYDPKRLAKGAFIVSFSVWMPYLYWGFIVWRGDFSKVSVHPWLEISLIAALIGVIARREPAPATDSHS